MSGAATERLSPAELLEHFPGAALDEVRLAGTSAPVQRVSPDAVEGFQLAFRLARERGLGVLLAGNGTKLAWSPPAPPDLVLSTRRFTGILEHEPGDGTLTARAGTELTALGEAVRTTGHHVCPVGTTRAPETLGGAIGVGRAGIDRLRHGPLRHHLLGARVLLPDGRLSRSGGALVKNVTGYDLHRLWCGSHGSLVLVLEASLRLHALPDRTAVLRAELADTGAALEAAARLGGLPLRPLAVVAHDGGGPVRLDVALAGRAEVVEFESEHVRGVLPGARSAPDAEAAWRELRDAEHEPRWPDLVLATTPSRLGSRLERLTALLREAPGARHVLHPLVALAWTWLPDLEAGERARLLRAAATELAAPGVSVLPRGVEELRLAEPPGAALMRELRRALDPEGLLAPARLPWAGLSDG